MFWRTAGLVQSSPIELVLDRESFTLEDLLEEDDVIQECKSLNNRLINFLKTKPVVEKLVGYMVETPEHDADAKREFKYPYLACEIFCCEIDAVFSTLVDNDCELFSRVLGFVDSDAPLNPMLACYFSKTVACLFSRRGAECMAFLQGKLHLLDRLVDHIGVLAVAEVLLRLVGADEGQMGTSDVSSWLVDTPLLDRLLDALGPDREPTVHANAAEVLVGIARNAPSALAAKLASKESLGRLFAQGLATPESPLVNVLDIAISIIDSKRAAAVAQPMQQFMQDPSDIAPPRDPPPEAVEGCLECLESLLVHIDVDGDSSTQQTPWGTLTPPLGLRRLKVVDILATLVRTKSDSVAEVVIRLRALPTCMKLFHKYPFNNFLHHHVDSMVMAVLEWGHDGMLQHLFDADACDIIGVLTGAAQGVDTARGPIRAGNLGHVTRLSNKLVEAAGGSEAVARALAADPRWTAHVDGALAVRNQVENVYKWACGRPAGMDDSQGNESEGDDEFSRDFDIGLGGPGGFGRDVYHRYGAGLEGGGEEDEEEDDDDEEFFMEDDSSGKTGEEAHLAALGLGDDDSRGGGGGGAGDDDSSDEDEEAGAAIAPLDAYVSVSAPGQRGGRGAEEEEDDEVLLVDSDEDDDSDLIVGVAPEPSTSAASPTSPKSPTELLKKEGAAAAKVSVTRTSPMSPVTAQGRPGTPAHPPASVASEPAAPVDASYNAFNFWKPNVDDSLVPDDI